MVLLPLPGGPQRMIKTLSRSTMRRRDCSQADDLLLADGLINVHSHIRERRFPADLLDGIAQKVEAPADPLQLPQ